MQRFGPRAMSPRDGLDWLRQAMQLLLNRPVLFVAAALLAPLGSALLLTLPVWNTALPLLSDGFAVVSTVLCYGLPLAFAISLACGFARAVNRQNPLPLRQLLIPTVFRVLLRSSLFLVALLLQAYLAGYLVRNLVSPESLMATAGGKAAVADPFFGVADTLLGTQLGMIGGLLLVLQLLFAGFVTPLHLFRELPLYTCWRLSFLAIQLNPWLLPALGLPGLVFILLCQFPIFSVLTQVLALPLPAYLGALLYVAWMDVFQGGVEEETLEQEAIPQV
jgi:hypothetical protein